MTSSPITPVVLSGGSGTRLWPMSRALFPKQFLPLVGQEGLLVETVRRLSGAPRFTPPIVICNEDHRFIVAEQLRTANLPPMKILLEPVGRSTAPAAAMAALIVAAERPDGLLLVAASDHAIRDVEAWRSAIDRAAVAARAGYLVTFGIEPTAPDTGYGYIRAGETLPMDGVMAVAQFVEKPNLETAQSYLADGGYYWNCGCFLFRADCLLAEMERYQPAMLAACKAALAAAQIDLDFVRLDRETFEACPSDSIDYAIMERTDAAAMAPVDMGWSDVGSWDSLWEVGAKDATGNVTVGDVIAVDVKDSYLRSEESQLLSAVGVENLVVVVTADAVFVSTRDRASEVRLIVERLKQAGRPEATAHTRVYRPWGWYESIDGGDRFQVKRIMVKPGGRLSAQMHHHRAEHWVVVNGTARVTRGEEVTLLHENQSIYIPLGAVHRLENPGKLPLNLIEVQSGSYLGEDDIVRFQDDYGRS